MSLDKIRLIIISGLLLGMILIGSGCRSWYNQSDAINSEGVIYYQEGNYDRALAEFQQAIQANPNNAEAYYNLASTYQRQATVQQQPALNAQAENYYRACLDRNPTSETTVCCYRGMATIMNQQNRQQEALALLRSWESRNPNAIDPKLEIAYLLEAQGKNEEALGELQAASKIAPNDYRPYYKAGAIKERLGENQAALDQLQMAGRLRPADMEIASRITALRTKAGSSPTGAVTAVAKDAGSKNGNSANWNNGANSSVASTAPTISMTPPTGTGKNGSAPAPAGVNPVTVQTTGATAKTTAGPPASTNLNVPQSQLTQSAPVAVPPANPGATPTAAPTTGTGVAAQAPALSGAKATTPSAGANTAQAVHQAPAAQNTVKQAVPPRKTQELLSPGPPNINVSAGF